MCTANKTYSSCVPRCVVEFKQHLGWWGIKDSLELRTACVTKQHKPHSSSFFPPCKKIQLFIWFVQSNITCVGSTSACDRKHRLSVVIVIHLGPITAECFVTYSGKTPQEVHGSSSRRGHRRNPFFHPTRPGEVLVSCISLQSSQTENSDPPRRPWVNSIRRRRRSPVNGLHHSKDGELPNTAFMPSHLMRRSQVGFSFLRRSISCNTFEPTSKGKISQ